MRGKLKGTSTFPGGYFVKLPNTNKLKLNPLLAAFLIPFIGMLVVMLVSQYEPFGKYSMLYSDCYHQYYPFFLAFRQALRSGDSLLYSWAVGLGMDYLGLISYYLASPLNLFSVIVPERWLLEYFSLLTPVRLGLASLFFAMFLKKTFRREDLSIAVFGGFYGLCAWAMGYMWNVMWVDTFALLPLVALGTVALLRDKKFILYTVTLFLSVYSNYYIGFFTCIFVLLLFLCYEICRWPGMKRFFLDLCRIAFFSLLAIGMTAILTLPAFAALQTTQSSVNNFPKGFRLNIADENTWKGLIDAMGQVAGNMFVGVKPSFKEGLPNLYCGVGSVFLGLLYLLAKQVKFRDKVASLLLLIFFMLSVIIRQLDYIWHGFHFTNMIPYRFTFLFSFVLLYMAYRAWMLRQSFRPWQMITAGLLSVALMCCSNFIRHWEGNPSLVFVNFNVGFLAIYLGIMLYGQWPAKITEETDEEELQKIRETLNKRRFKATLILVAVMAMELVANLMTFGLNFTGTSVSNYPKGTDHAASMIRYMKEREENTLFYRAETTHSQTLNDGALNGYTGISAFTSSANVKVTEFMKALGYGAKNTYNRYCYEEASPVSNLFLGIKYMIERDGKDKQSAYFEQIHSYGDVALLENRAYLPLGFLAEPELAELKFSGGATSFRFQNELMKAATGIDGDVWKLVSDDDLVIEGLDVTIKDQGSGGYCAYSDAISGSSVRYFYTVETDGFMCIDLNFPKRNSVTILKNDVELYSETTSLPQMMAVCDVAVGDVVEVRAACKADEDGTLTVTAAILNEALFYEGYEILNASTLELTEFSNTQVSGIVSCDRDGLLYTSIPQNGNWSVRVDGRKTEVVLVGDAMVGVMLTEGTHDVTFTYRNEAFAMGWKISLICLAALGLLIWLTNRKPKGKYSR